MTLIFINNKFIILRILIKKAERNYKNSISFWCQQIQIRLHILNYYRIDKQIISKKYERKAVSYILKDRNKGNKVINIIKIDNEDLNSRKIVQIQNQPK
ncbi:unnamed protein product [Paramecium octaurelia]|uniref:Uncharacterized protein n=1 Tax=Paramecium octaurelia TaxID=43137 RepID=A0A8S1Y399_PAROT|nr:unnamed protein product [Paramecium octaurelia]